MRNLILIVTLLAAQTSLASDPWSGLSDFAFTKEAREAKMRREFTGLGYAPRTTVAGILEWIRARRGGTEPLAVDDDEPAQLVLTDAQGKKWKAMTDGWVMDVSNDRGEHPSVFEAKAKWFDASELDRMHLVLDALLSQGAVPYYAYGGGHIHLQVKNDLAKEPVKFASLINLALTYEPVLTYLMSHETRNHQCKTLAMTRMPGSQMTYAQYLGHGLNTYLENPKLDCSQDPELKPYLRENPSCILAFMAHYAERVIDDRTYSINLKSWRGAASRKKIHGSVEFRLFNAPANHLETSLEERLVRLMDDQAFRAGPSGIRYEEKIDAAYDLNSYYGAYYPDAAREQFGDFLKKLGMPASDQAIYLREYLDPEKQQARRSR